MYQVKYQLRQPTKKKESNENILAFERKFSKLIQTGRKGKTTKFK